MNSEYVMNKYPEKGGSKKCGVFSAVVLLAQGIGLTRFVSNFRTCKSERWSDHSWFLPLNAGD
ncbi:hypothetical protein METP3_01411 [Methanosarcinales archaeon]|nr:hypothetical protein METP3_01411 [Methanosarcinales archaeon]